MANDAVKHGAYCAKLAQRLVRRGVIHSLVATIRRTIPANKTFIDFGAGPGHYVRAIRDPVRNVDGIGLDAMEGVETLGRSDVLRCDLASDEVLQLVSGREFDWAISIEVGEHIPRSRAHYFLDAIAHAKQGIVISWAPPTQRGGRGHINCRTPEWVVEQFEQRGFELARRSTGRARARTRRGFDRKLLILRRASINQVDKRSRLSVAKIICRWGKFVDARDLQGLALDSTPMEMLARGYLLGHGYSLAEVLALDLSGFRGCRRPYAEDV